jgi:hypothetical protein
MAARPEYRIQMATTFTQTFAVNVKKRIKYKGAPQNISHFLIEVVCGHFQS